MRRALALAAAMAAAALAGPAASAATVCVPGAAPAAEGCLTAYYAPGHLCVTGTVTVAGVPVIDRPPCR